MDWDEVVGHMRERHQVGHASGTWIELWQRFREGARAIRQHQTLRIIACHGQIYYVIEAEVAVPAQARAALCEHAELGTGFLVERGDALVVQVKVPSSALSPAALDRILHAVAREAIQLSLFVWQRLHAAAQQSQPPASTRSAS